METNNDDLELYKYGHNICEESIKLDKKEFDEYVKRRIYDYIDGIDMSTFDGRIKVRKFLSYLNTLFLNICLNYNLYFLTEREEELGFRGREIITEIINELQIKLNK